jgi:hypothetical protein
MYPNTIYSKISKLVGYSATYELYNVKVGANRFIDIHALITEPIQNHFASRVMRAWSDKYSSVSASGKSHLQKSMLSTPKKGITYNKQMQYIQQALLAKVKQNPSVSKRTKLLAAAAQVTKPLNVETSGLGAPEIREMKVAKVEELSQGAF